MMSLVGKHGTEEMVVATEGKRYDVKLRERRRYAVYWEQTPTEVRRCSWFHKGSKDMHFSPFTEELGEILEVRHEEGTYFIL